MRRLKAESVYKKRADLITRCHMVFSRALQREREAFFDYSLLRPTFPTFLRPIPPIAQAKITQPKLTQNVTRYPSMSACGEVLEAKSECSVTDDDILAMTARPSEVPNCASVWNTAPPSA